MMHDAIKPRDLKPFSKNLQQIKSSIEQHHGKYFLPSTALAEGVERSHKALMNTIQNHMDALIEVGGQAVFEIRLSKLKTRHQKIEIALLNEDHFNYLMTTFRDSPLVRVFKVAMVKELSRLKKEVQDLRIQRLLNNHNPDWIQSRESGKATRQVFTAIIDEQLVPYAIANGSKNSRQYYALYSRMINAALFNITDGYKMNRDDCTQKQHDHIKMAERVVGEAIYKGVSVNQDYHEIFKNAKKLVTGLAGIIGQSAMPSLPDIDGVKVLEVFD